MKFFDRMRIAMNQVSWDQYMRLSCKDADDGDGSIAVTEDAAMKYSAVFGCCRVLAETFASCPAMEYKRSKDGDREKTDDTGLYSILHDTPNDEMNAFSFAEVGMYELNLSGNFVARRVKNRVGGVIGLYPLLHNSLEIKRNAETKAIEYVVREPAGSPPYRRTDVFHVAGPSMNGITGMSPISYAAQGIRLGLTYESFGVNYFQNGAAPSGIFKHPGKLGDEAYKRLKADLEGNYRSMLSKGRPILAEDGLTYEPFQLNMVDSQLLESKKFQVEDICRMYRVPLHLVQNLDRATNNNIEHQSLEFVMYTMLPWFRRYESAINSQLLSAAQRKDGYYIEYNMAGLLRGDSKSMAESFATGRQWGWLNVNEIRRLLNMNGIGPEGDIYLQPSNMIIAGEKVQAQYQNLVDEMLKLIETRKG
jgi:HK97 family phage portal protein